MKVIKAYTIDSISNRGIKMIGTVRITLDDTYYIIGVDISNSVINKHLKDLAYTTYTSFELADGAVYSLLNDLDDVLNISVSSIIY